MSTQTRERFKRKWSRRGAGNAGVPDDTYSENHLAFPLTVKDLPLETGVPLGEHQSSRRREKGLMRREGAARRFMVPACLSK
jgi:hypothetical protein